MSSDSGKDAGLSFRYNDGGRQAAGYRGLAGDCVTRALAILLELDYRDTYRTVARAVQSVTGRRSARNGVPGKLTPKVFAAYGLRKVSLPPGRRPTLAEAHARFGNCIVQSRRPLSAVCNGSLQDVLDLRDARTPDGLGGTVLTPRKAMSVWLPPGPALPKPSRKVPPPAAPFTPSDVLSF